MLPFIHPTSVLVVDDDQLFLDSFEYRYSTALNCRTEASPQRAVELLKLNNADWLRHMDFYETRLGESSGDPVRCLKRQPLLGLSRDEDRRSTIAVVIVDYAMPGMSGVDFCRSIRELPVRKILLTGQAGESTAVSAFNEGLIDCFLTKQDPGLPVELQKVVERLRHRFFEKVSSALAPFPTIATHIVSLADHSAKLREKLAQIGAVEYFVWDEPPGLLAVDASGTKIMIVLFDVESMRSQLEVAEICAAPAALLEGLRNHTMIAWFPTPNGYYDPSYADSWNKHVAKACAIESEKFWMATFTVRDKELIPLS